MLLSSVFTLRAGHAVSRSASMNAAGRAPGSRSPDVAERSSAASVGNQARQRVSMTPRRGGGGRKKRVTPLQTSFTLLRSSCLSCSASASSTGVTRLSKLQGVANKFRLPDLGHMLSA
jgi:hypothetical protein